MASTTNTYNSIYTGQEVDSSVSNAPIGLTAAQLVNPTAEILKYNSSKIIIVTQAASAEAAKQFTVGSLWHIVSGTVQPLGNDEESVFGIVFADVSTSGSSTTTITKSKVETAGVDLKVNELILSKSSDIYRVTEVTSSKYKVAFCQNIAGLTGQRGSLWYVGNELYLDPNGQIVISDSSTGVPSYQVGDMYLVSENYGSFMKGNVYRCVNKSGVVATFALQTTLQGDKGDTGAQGPQGQAGENGTNGVDGRDGVRWTVGQSLNASVGGLTEPEVYWLKTLWPQEDPRVGDLYLIAETYPQTGTGFLFAQGDVYEVKTILTDRATMQKKTNIKGEPGVAGIDGLNGAQILYADTTTSSSTTSISYNNLRANLHAPTIGDMIISASGDVFVIMAQQAPSDVSTLTSLTGTEWKLSEKLDIDSAIESGAQAETYHINFISDSGDISTDMKFSKRNGILTLSYDDEVKYGDFGNDLSASEAGASTSIIGDMNNDGEVTSDDAIYLLRHTLFPASYPIDKFADFDGNGKITSDDAVYLLRHTLFPNKYPLDGDKSGVDNSRWESQKERTIFISGGSSHASPILLPWMKNSRNATLLGTDATVRYCMNIGSSSGLPPVTPADAGKFAVVDSNGHWAAVTIDNWTGGNY